METYEEKQVFKLWWTFIPIAIFSLLPILLFAEEKESMPALIIAGIVLLVVGWLLLSMKQVIRINPNGVYYKQSPFHRKFQIIPWATIQDWKVIKINAFSDFGGWGIRITRKKKGYIMEGEYGLELQTAAKKLTVLSVKNKEAVEKVVLQHFKTMAS